MAWCMASRLSPQSVGVARSSAPAPLGTLPADPVSGRYRQVSATASTKREAEDKLTQLLTEVAAGQHQGPDVTMGELLDQWFAIASPDWSPKKPSNALTAASKQRTTQQPSDARERVYIGAAELPCEARSARAASPQAVTGGRFHGRVV